MSAKVQILEFAKEDYRKIRRWVKAEFGLQVWSKIEAEYKQVLTHIGQSPMAGSVPNELLALGLQDYRQRMVKQTRIIYQIKGDRVFVHLFVDSSRDFSEALYQRLMA